MEAAISTRFRAALVPTSSASMTKYSGLTLREARARFFAESGFPPDGGYEISWWSIRFGKLKIYLPNFRWRRRAVIYHDLHHVLTGYRCSPMGEMQIAAWEFAAGSFPNRFATLFCLPLVIVGAMVSPNATFAAFLQGRNSSTLYSVAITDDLLETPIDTLRQKLLPGARQRASRQDWVAYFRLVFVSFMALSIALSPCVAAILVFVMTRITE
jgi:hypothetical protein